MREFIGNPFQQEYEDGDELDEFEFEDLTPIVEAERIMGPDMGDEEDEEEEDMMPLSDDEDDPDYILTVNDGYDPEDDDFEFDSVHDDVDYEFRGFSSDDEEEDDLDYVTFPVSENNSIETPNKTSQESSNASNSDQEFLADET